MCVCVSQGQVQGFYGAIALERYVEKTQLLHRTLHSVCCGPCLKAVEMEIAARSSALLPKQLVRLRRTLKAEDRLELVSSHSTI